MYTSEYYDVNFLKWQTWIFSKQKKKSYRLQFDMEPWYSHEIDMLDWAEASISYTPIITGCGETEAGFVSSQGFYL